MTTTTTEANAYLRLADLDPLPRNADAAQVAAALADAFQVLDK
jgi:hypothetical protein